MASKLLNWEADVDIAINRLQKSGLVFPFEESAKFIDFLASHKFLTRDELIAAAKNIRNVQSDPESSSFIPDLPDGFAVS
jgi:hypothetical protein